MREHDRRGTTPLAWAMAGALFLLCLAPSASGEGKVDEWLGVAKSAWKQKQFDRAAAAYEAAWARAPERLDLLLRAAESYDKAKRADAALRAYGALADACDKQSKAQGSSAELKSTRRKAAARIKALGKVAAQQRALCDRRVTKLVKLAEKHENDAPLVSLRALDCAAVLGASGGQFDELLKRLKARVDSPSDAVKSPFESQVQKWTNLLQSENFPGHKGWTFSDTSVIIDCKAGESRFTNKPPTSSEPYVYEMEMRAERVYSDQWGIGLLFGRVKQHSLLVWINPGGVEMETCLDSRAERIVGIARPPSEPDVWHRLSVHVKDGTLSMWLDGRQLASREIPTGWTQAGGYGVMIHGGRFEIRQLRMGVPK